MAGSKRREIKLSDVARAANTSVATVSRLINGRAGTTPEVRERVIKAAIRLGYDIEKRRRSKVIAFLLSNRTVLHPLHSAMLMGAEAYCATVDYGLLFLPLQYSYKGPWNALHLPEILKRRQFISGVIVAGTNSVNLLELLTQVGIPWVVLGNNVLGDWSMQQANSVYFDDIGGSYDAVRYLLSIGHRRIAYVGSNELPWFLRREEGYLRAMKEACLDPCISKVNSEDEEEMGYLATKLVLQRTEPVTAIFAGGDTAARGAYKAVSDSGLKIPEDISIVGFSDTAEASTLHPPLTSVRIFPDQIGKQLAEQLLKRIARPDLPQQAAALPTQLIKRESCRPLFPIQYLAPNEKAGVRESKVKQNLVSVVE